MQVHLLFALGKLTRSWGYLWWQWEKNSSLWFSWAPSGSLRILNFSFVQSLQTLVTGLNGGALPITSHLTSYVTPWSCRSQIYELRVVWPVPSSFLVLKDPLCCRTLVFRFTSITSNYKLNLEAPNPSWSQILTYHKLGWIETSLSGLSGCGPT